MRVCLSVEAFEIFSQGRDLESCGDFPWMNLVDEPDDLSDCEPVSCELVRVVLDVTDVLASLSSVVTELCDVSPCCSDWEDVEPQSFSFSKKRAHCCTDTQEEMRYEGSQGKALSMARRRMTPPTPKQNSYALFEGEQGRYEVEGWGWSAKERTLSAKTVCGKKPQVEALEDLSSPEDVDVDFRRILKEARDGKRAQDF